MAARLRLVLPVLVLVLAWSGIFAPGVGVAAEKKQHRLPRLKVPRLRHQEHHRAPLPRVKVAPAPQPEATVGDRAARYARRLLGIPYRYGGDSPQSGFDCSGLVRFVYSRFGVTLPHSSYADFSLGRHVTRAQLRPGDLVFFDGVGHVGMYIGGGRFIHAPHTGTRVQVSSMDESWYRDRYDGARRLALPRALVPRRWKPATRAEQESRRDAAERSRLRALRLRLG
jgi:hypothetical protein